MKRLFIPLLLLILLCFTCRSPLSPEEQGYAVPEQGVGQAQSPINILTSGTVDDEADDVFVSFRAPIKGSLTTTPYTEKVDWIILNQAIEASPRQIMEIEKMEGYNARHIQSLFDRSIAVHYGHPHS